MREGGLRGEAALGARLTVGGGRGETAGVEGLEVTRGGGAGRRLGTTGATLGGRALGGGGCDRELGGGSWDAALVPPPRVARGRELGGGGVTLDARGGGVDGAGEAGGGGADGGVPTFCAAEGLASAFFWAAERVDELGDEVFGVALRLVAITPTVPRVPPHPSARTRFRGRSARCFPTLACYHGATYRPAAQRGKVGLTWPSRFRPMHATTTSSSPIGNVRFESVGPKTTLDRLDAWDAARLIATFGIVWTHVCDAQGLGAPVGTLGRFGTSYYILAAALFVVRGYPRSAGRKFSVEAGRRAKRLLLPFLIWSGLYFVYYYAGSWNSGESFASLTFWWGPAAGTALHLWFLPFIYVWGLWGVWAVPRLMVIPPRLLMLAGPIGCAVVYWICYRYIFFWVDRPWLWKWHLHRLDRWIDEAPLYLSAIILGTAFYRTRASFKAALGRHRITLGWASLIAFALVQVLYSQHVDGIRAATGTEGRFMANLAGLALLAGSAAISHTRLIRALAPLGRFTYVAFLVHMLVLEAFRAPMKFLPAYGSIPTALLCTFWIFFISLGLSWLVARSKIFAWLRP